MSRFVEECRKEWNRLGVPEVVSNEMAADLDADLAEAEAEGASAEQVLGNGIFDAKSFAASWATARGVVPLDRGARNGVRPTRWWVVVTSAVVSLIVALAGLAILVRRHEGSVAVAIVRHSLALPFLGPFAGSRSVRIGPGIPGHLVVTQGGTLDVLGLVLAVVGLVGLGLTLWHWRPWSRFRRPPGADDDMGLPSYL